MEPCGEGDVPRKVRKKVEPWDHPKWVRFTGLDNSDDRRLEYFAINVVESLRAKGMTDAQFMALNHHVMHWDFYRPHIRMGAPKSEDIVDMRRLKLCLDELSSGASLEAAVTRAIAAVPMGTLKLLSSHRCYCLGTACPCSGVVVGSRA